MFDQLKQVIKIDNGTILFAIMTVVDWSGLNLICASNLLQEL